MTEPGTEPDDRATAQQLGESFAALVGNQDWQVDEVPEAASFSEPEPAQPPNHPTTQPPLAEPVNEPTVPPTPLQIVEALLFVGGPPLTAEHAADAIRGLSAEQFRDCVETLNRVYRAQNRPYSVVPERGGYVMRVGRRFATVREKLYGGPREARLTQQALDVLSLVAYRQPVGKAEIDSVRGSDSGGVLRQLVRLGLVAATTSGEGESKETLYATTARFLEVFHLRGLDDLPELGEPERI
ncbi:MAG TPA: SMC-Scp complex subunit ScpB [Gemmataceae bacterium]|nr:SMC-Scp complex subunit ScpB [Gemmataceae bacterium]